MASPKTKGRMLNRNISNSKGFASLSPESAVLFCMMIPHMTAHGKMNGDPHFIKGEVCPRIPYLSIGNIGDCLREISIRTNVKWFMHDGRYWIHSVNFLTDHQNLNPERLGEDLLPSYSGLSPELVPPEVEVRSKKLEVRSRKLEVRSRKKEVKPLSGLKSPDGSSNSIPFGEIIGHLNKRTGKSFKENAEATRRLIRGRWSEGFRVEDFLSVIENQARDWMGDEKMEKYLRPETLFGKTKFEGYLNNTASRHHGEPKGWKGLREYMRELQEEKNDAGGISGGDCPPILDVP